MSETKPPYGQHFQDQVLLSIITDDDFARDVQRQLKPEQFSAGLTADLVKLALDYFHEYSVAPKDDFAEVVRIAYLKRSEDDRADCLDYLTKLHDMESPKTNHLLQRIGKFIRDSGWRQAIVEAAVFIENGEHARVEKLLRDTIKRAQLAGEESEPDFLPYEPFPTDCLPEPLRKYVTESAAALGCDEGFVGASVLAVASSAIGNTRHITIKSSWSEPPVLWVGIVGASGTLKSPAIDAAMKPLHRLQADAAIKATRDAEKYADDLLIYEQQLKSWKSGGDTDAAIPRKPELPADKRLYTSDSTVEALAAMLQQNGRGILMAPGELAGWLGAFDQYKKGGASSDAARWLELFHGRTLIVDRKSGPRMYIPMASACVLGGIQPGELRRLLGRKYFDCGIAARTLLCKPPRRAKRWTDADISPETDKAYSQVIERLLRLDFITADDEQPRPRHLSMSPKALTAWAAFVNEQGQRTMTADADLAAAYSKLEGITARLALIFRLVRWAAGTRSIDEPDTIAEIDVQDAVRLVMWWCRETERVYLCLRQGDLDAELTTLAEMVEERGGIITIAALQHTNQRKYKKATHAKAELQRLVDGGYGEFITHKPDGPGRPSESFVLYDFKDAKA